MLTKANVHLTNYSLDTLIHVTISLAHVNILQFISFQFKSSEYQSQFYENWKKLNVDT